VIQVTQYFSGINKAGETKNLYVSDYLNRSAGYLPASDHKQNAIQIVVASSVSLKGSIEYVFCFHYYFPLKSYCRIVHEIYL
jgi:hypothetical protein